MSRLNRLPESSTCVIVCVCVCMCVCVLIKNTVSVCVLSISEWDFDRSNRLVDHITTIDHIGRTRTRFIVHVTHRTRLIEAHFHIHSSQSHTNTLSFNYCPQTHDDKAHNTNRHATRTTRHIRSPDPGPENGFSRPWTVLEQLVADAATRAAMPRTRHLIRLRER